MRLPSPKHLKDYPKYIFFYWLFAWSIFFLVKTAMILANRTEDGKFVEKRDCKALRDFGESEECIQYSIPYYVPLREEFKNAVVESGWSTLSGAIFLGGFNMVYRWRKDKEISKRWQL